MNEVFAIDRNVDYHTGQPVIYETSQESSRWIVDKTSEDGTVVLRDVDGRTFRVAVEDPCLRPATWWERFRHRQKFPQPMIP